MGRKVGGCPVFVNGDSCRGPKKQWVAVDEGGKAIIGMWPVAERASGKDIPLFRIDG